MEVKTSDNLQQNTTTDIRVVTESPEDEIHSAIKSENTNSLHAGKQDVKIKTGSPESFKKFTFAVVVDNNDNNGHIDTTKSSRRKSLQASSRKSMEPGDRRSCPASPLSRKLSHQPQKNRKYSSHVNYTPVELKATSCQADPSARRRESLQQRKESQQPRKVAFSDADQDPEDLKPTAAAECTPKRSSKGGTKKKEYKHRKYSLHFFKKEKAEEKEEIEDAAKERTRSNSTFEMATQPQQFALTYDVDTMRKKSCIALTNSQLNKNNDGIKASVDQCTSLVKAIEIAAFEINQKEQKNKRHSKNKHSTNEEEDNVQITIDECKNSELMVSNLNRLDSRRLAISERSEIERKLVKQSVKYLIQDEFITWCQD